MEKKERKYIIQSQFSSTQRGHNGKQCENKSYRFVLISVPSCEHSLRRRSYRTKKSFITRKSNKWRRRRRLQTVPPGRKINCYERLCRRKLATRAELTQNERHKNDFAAARKKYQSGPEIIYLFRWQGNSH
jgi:hypothetical protein